MTSYLLAGAIRRHARAAACALALAATAALGAMVAHAAPPAGTPIGNQASATYLDAASQTHTVTSNAVVTIVQQVASFTLTANNARTSAPGGQAVYPHDLTNTGNGTDAFALSAANLGGDNFDLTGLAIYADADANGVPDNFTPIATTGPLAAGASFHFVVMGSVPGTQVGGDVALSRITATSGFNGALTASNDDQVTVTGNAVLSLTDAISQASGGSPSGPYTYTMSYTNSGNATATNVRLTNLVPAGMTYVAGSGRWSVTGATVLTDADSTDAQGTAPATVRYDWNVATPGAVTAILAQVPPGQSGSVTFQVMVNAGLPPQVIDDAVRYAYFDGAANVGPFNTNLASFTVTQAVSLTFSGQTIVSALQGGLVAFTDHLVNTGNGTDRFNITAALGTFPAGSTVQIYQSNGVALLSDTNGDGIPDTGPVAPGASYDVIVKVQLPPGATGGPYTSQATARSVTSPAASVTVNNTLNGITANTVDLTNNSAGGPGAGPGPEAVAVVSNAVNPGATTRFTLVVANTSFQPDNWDLVASTDPSFATTTLPAGWTVTFLNTGNSVISNTGSIAAGLNTTVYADVTVPAGAAAANTELYFRSRSPVSGATDRLHDQVRVNVVRSLSLVPNNTAQVIPGGFALYTHTLTNNGNVAEGDGAGSLVTLGHADNQAGWSSALYWDTNGSGVFDAGDQPISDLATAGGLAPGASVRIFAQVFAPAGAPLGQLNTTTVTATTSNLAYTSTVPAVVGVTDGTTIINGQLVISKLQCMDRDCNGVEDSTFTSVNLAYGAVPGACIRYEITVTNIGTTNVTGVVINDATPANTVSSNAASATSTVGTISVPANGATGTVTATIGTLGPGQSAVIHFSVRINP
jgi:uncharacterized repeat protein (TIGR01451 family)